MLTAVVLLFASFVRDATRSSRRTRRPQASPGVDTTRELSGPVDLSNLVLWGPALTVSIGEGSTWSRSDHLYRSEPLGISHGSTATFPDVEVIYEIFIPSLRSSPFWSYPKPSSFPLRMA